MAPPNLQIYLAVTPSVTFPSEESEFVKLRIMLDIPSPRPSDIREGPNYQSVDWKGASQLFPGLRRKLSVLVTSPVFV